MDVSFEPRQPRHPDLPKNEPTNIVNELTQLSRTGHVNAGGGFIQEKNFRLMNDGGSNSKLALHPLGISAELAVRSLSQTEIIQQFFSSILTFGLPQAIEL
jgi:hypothetical protein